MSTAYRFVFVVFASASFGCAARTPRATTPVPVEVAQAPPTPPPAPPPQTKEAPRSTGIITRGELNQVLDAAPGRFLQHVETEPRFVGGRFSGWKLASFFPGDERFAAVDLQPGDVILSVNGQSIEQPDQLMQVWESLRFEHTLLVAIERGGVRRQLRYEIRE